MFLSIKFTVFLNFEIFFKFNYQFFEGPYSNQNKPKLPVINNGPGKPAKEASLPQAVSSPDNNINNHSPPKQPKPTRPPGNAPPISGPRQDQLTKNNKDMETTSNASDEKGKDGGNSNAPPIPVPTIGISAPKKSQGPSNHHHSHHHRQNTEGGQRQQGSSV